MMARVGTKTWLIAPAIFGKLILKIVKKNELKHFQNKQKNKQKTAPIISSIQVS
jgi:hypothetical protein